MTRWLHPAAADDLREAIKFHAKRAGVELAEAFLAEYDRTAERLDRHPELGVIGQ